MVGQLDVDASNACIPPTSPLVSLDPPLPSTVRGEVCVLDGAPGRLNNGRAVVAYGSGRLVVVRELGSELSPGKDEADGAEKGDASVECSWSNKNIRAFVYRGHTARVTAVKFSASGCYVASGDVRGHLRVWSYDNNEHLCKLDMQGAMIGPIRDISWDMDNRRICLVGETTSSSPKEGVTVCRVIQWDTGVSCGDLAQHNRGRATTCAFRQRRPFRIVTGGEDGQVLFNGHTPFRRIVPDQVGKHQHQRTVNCVRYAPDNDYFVTVGADRIIRIFDGATANFRGEQTDAHAAAIKSCSWSSDGSHILTSSADGTAKLWQLQHQQDNQTSTLSCVHTWDIAKHQLDLLPQQSLTTDFKSPESPTTVVSPTASASSPPKGPRGLSTTPMGGMQLGCAFVRGNVPVSVGFNGQIAILPRPSCLQDSSPSSECLQSDEQTLILTGHQGNISSLALDRKSGRLYTSDTDGVIVQWDTTTGQAGRVHAGSADSELVDEKSDQGALLGKVHRGAITSLALAEGGGTDEMLLSIGWDDTLRISCPTSDNEADIKTCCHVTQLKHQPNSLSIGKTVAVIATVGGLVLVKANVDGVVAPLSEALQLSYGALSVSVSPDDRTVAVGGDNGTVYIYQITEDKLHLQYTIDPGHGRGKSVSSIAFSPDGSMLATADTRDVCVWDATTPDFKPLVAVNRWCFHTQRVTSLAWSPDGKILASGGMDDCIFLWNVAKKMRRVHYKFTHRGGVVGMDFLNNDVLVSAGCDGCVCQWNVAKDVKAKFG